ncbi:hypothetical protein [Streptomyces chryseus]|uniref:Uncharacterized protein n=1 Tax=Streptomyces chryseus TaxID=68186 RepID=A0ABQ3DF57_9ACTN|nr:hypothetical protein [Streptomyces chryseus]GHA83214.1 hypothetical protein GCM10010346_01930 [Streptomyces chryseus]
MQTRTRLAHRARRTAAVAASIAYAVVTWPGWLVAVTVAAVWDLVAGHPFAAAGELFLAAALAVGYARADRADQYRTGSDRRGSCPFCLRSRRRRAYCEAAAAKAGR